MAFHNYIRMHDKRDRHFQEIEDNLDVFTYEEHQLEDNVEQDEASLSQEMVEVRDQIATSFNREHCRKALAEMVIVDELSFRFKRPTKFHTAIRNTVRYVRSSPARLLKFKSCVEREKIEYKGLICLDVPTRWNSTYMMLDAAIKFQKAFKRYEEEDDKFVSYFWEDEGEKRKIGPPLDDDWENVKVFVKYLKTFYDITLKFSATLNVTSNSYFHELCDMQNQLSELSKQEDSMLSSMSNVKDTMYRLHEVYSGEKGESVTNENSGEAATTSTTEVKIEAKGKGCLWSSFVRKMKENNVNEYKNDVDKYLTDPMEDPTRSNFNVLDWWKNNATNYKVLSLVAKDILAILVSTVASEAFSTGGRILDPFRSSLSPKMVEALICTQNWLRSREQLNFIDME
ncbi:zinc finger BED domain-containing protein RICESLEEPER 2-like [Morus notabilis]|uniref:zinc finger BED domain-containing protein RICESLEEPER 2-like n=1 Tax=Morus notabilis TaxID=981085 RepID=UPI000CED294E|nr:zinc finger BED domain-containing protein RICESLEEPER 2-like [Morus notabilis]